MSAGDGALQAVIFDVDGTLVDSERDGHRVAFNRAFEEFGLPDRWDEDRYGDLLAITGGRYRIDAHLRDRGVPEAERADLAPRLHARKTEIFQEMVRAGQVPRRPGAERLIAELERAGVRVAVATTGTRAWVDPLLERLFGADRFEIVVTGDEAPVRKPDPSAHVTTLELLRLPAGAAVAIEDSRNGLLAAAAAGLPCVMVVNDYTRGQDLAGADLILDGFGDPGRPAAVLHDPHGIEPPGLLDTPTMRRVAARQAPATRGQGGGGPARR